VTSLIVGVIAGILVSLLGASAKKLADMARYRRNFGYLYALLAGAKRIQIVVPSLEAPVFVPQGTTQIAKVPKNVKVMPLAEGTAIAQLVSALHRLRNADVQIVSQENYQDTGGLTISVGGPSLNSVSRILLDYSFPKFSIKYPEHIASYGSTTFSPSTNSEGDLTEDYGFVAVGRTVGGSRGVVICGVWAFGTQIAAASLLHLPRKSEARRLFVRKEDFFMVSHARVNGLWPGNVEIVEIRHEQIPARTRNEQVA